MVGKEKKALKRGGEEGGRGRLSTTALCGALNRSEEEGKGKVRDMAGFLGVLPYRGFIAVVAYRLIFVWCLSNVSAMFFTRTSGDPARRTL